MAWVAYAVYAILAVVGVVWIASFIVAASRLRPDLRPTSQTRSTSADAAAR